MNCIVHGVLKSWTRLSFIHFHFINSTYICHSQSPDSPYHPLSPSWCPCAYSLSLGLYFSFSIIPSKEIPGLISFKMDWLDLLAVQETLKSLLQHHSSKASILQHSAFFTVQLSHPYMTTGKTVALTRRTFVGRLMKINPHFIGAVTSMEQRAGGIPGIAGPLPLVGPPRHAQLSAGPWTLPSVWLSGPVLHLILHETLVLTPVISAYCLTWFWPLAFSDLFLASMKWHYLRHINKQGMPEPALISGLQMW